MCWVLYSRSNVLSCIRLSHCKISRFHYLVAFFLIVINNLSTDLHFSIHFQLRFTAYICSKERNSAAGRGILALATYFYLQFLQLPHLKRDQNECSRLGNAACKLSSPTSTKLHAIFSSTFLFRNLW